MKKNNVLKHFIHISQIVSCDDIPDSGVTKVILLSCPRLKKAV
jgi:hypothetical protein